MNYLFFQWKESFDLESDSGLRYGPVIIFCPLLFIISDTRNIMATWCKLLLLPPNRGNFVTYDSSKSPLRQIVNVIPLWNMAIHNKQSNDLSFHTVSASGLRGMEKPWLWDIERITTYKLLYTVNTSTWTITTINVFCFIFLPPPFLVSSSIKSTWCHDLQLKNKKKNCRVLLNLRWIIHGASDAKKQRKLIFYFNIAVASLLLLLSLSGMVIKHP